ncbi:hypothetical protein [Streptomyces griseofuscus]|uniref:hypothetical protein n=1 Tax=Streptomyces griseofuscus TaxID=146922 RepID=UPI00382F80C8
MTVVATFDPNASRYTRSQGTVVRFGRKLVLIRITRGRYEYIDGTEARVLPEALEYGHHGTPRADDQWAEAALSMKRLNVREAAELAAQAGIITDHQADSLAQLWHEHTEPVRPEASS